MTEDIVSQAVSAATRLEIANKEMRGLLDEQKQLIDEQKQIQARNALGGNTDAGQKPIPPKEETPHEYAQRIMTNKPNPPVL
jgi:hypothetical protein